MQRRSHPPAARPRARARRWIAIAVMVLLLGLLWGATRPRWRPFGPPGDHMRLIVSPTFATDRTLFVRIDRTDLYRSTDAGASWQRLPGLNPYRMVFSPAYAADRTLIFVNQDSADALSTDGGATWATLPTSAADLWTLAVSGAPAPAIFAAGEAGDPTAAGQASPALYRSDDTGQSWQRLAVPQAELDDVAVTLSPTYATDHTVFLVAGPFGETVYRSQDDGRTWTDLAITLDRDVGVVFSPTYARDQTVFVVDINTLWRSTDAGRTWARMGMNLWGCSTNLQFATWPPADQIVLVGSSAQYRGADHATIHGSRDGGSTWHAQSLDTFPQQRFGGPEECLQTLAIAPTFPADPRMVVASRDALYLSRDAGATWTAYGDDSLLFFDVYLPAYFSHGGRVFATRDVQLYTIDLPR